MADQIFDSTADKTQITPPEKPLKFTNLPGKAGAETGYSFVPPLTQEEKEAKSVPSQPNVQQPVMQYPKRSEFEDHVFKTLGGNPFSIDPVKELEARTSEPTLKQLFNYVFKNRIYWGDRDQLDPKQKAFWDATVKAYRAQTMQEIESNKATQIDMYNNLMTRFDNDLNQQKAAEQRVAARQSAAIAALKERRLGEKAIKDEIKGAKAEQRQQDYLKIAKERHAEFMRKAKDTGAKEPKLADVQKIYKDERGELRQVTNEAGDKVWNYIGGINTGEQLDPEVLKQKNAARRAAGMPELEEVKTVDWIEPSTWDKFWSYAIKGTPPVQDAKESYLYVEKDKVDKLPTGMEESTPTTTVPEDIMQRLETVQTEEDFLREFPDAVKVENSYYIPKGDGNYLEITLQ